MALWVKVLDALEGDFKMIPLILAGAQAIAGGTVARLVSPIIAKKLIREGLGRAASSSTKVSPAKPITNMNQLPANMQKTAKPSPVKNTGKRTGKQAKELMERTKKNRQQIKEAKSERKVKTSAPTRINRGVEHQLKVDKIIRNQSGNKLSGALQARGAIKTTPKNQKGMSLPSKGQTVKRRKGGFMGKGAGCARRGY